MTTPADTTPIQIINMPNQKAITIGLSACLAGDKVRYNGGHCQSRLCLDQLAKHVNFLTFCPEVAAGFGTPRPTMRLVEGDDKKGVKLSYSNDDNSDLTDQLVQGFTPTLDKFSSLDGYILMKNSPSCGLHRIKVYQRNGHPKNERHQGLFAKQLQERYPLLPMEEEGRLHDAQLYENFMLRVYAHHNFRHEVLEQPSLHNLMKFHASYKYILMAQNQSLYQALGRLLANCHKEDLDEIIKSYFETFMHALAKPAKRQGHVNTLLHLFGYFKRRLNATAKQSILKTIEAYKAGHMSLITPLTMLDHYTSLYGSAYLKQQRYFKPYPDDLGLANRI